jgi:hypothetical protein
MSAADRHELLLAEIDGPATASVPAPLRLLGTRGRIPLTRNPQPTNFERDDALGCGPDNLKLNGPQILGQEWQDVEGIQLRGLIWLQHVVRWTEYRIDKRRETGSA